MGSVAGRRGDPRLSPRLRASRDRRAAGLGGAKLVEQDVYKRQHLDLPKSLEAYYQETGRAGRDGLPADAWMAYGLQDVICLLYTSRCV